MAKKKKNVQMPIGELNLPFETKKQIAEANQLFDPWKKETAKNALSKMKEVVNEATFTQNSYPFWHLQVELGRLTYHCNKLDDAENILANVLEYSVSSYKEPDFQRNWCFLSAYASLYLAMIDTTKGDIDKAMEKLISGHKWLKKFSKAEFTDEVVEVLLLTEEGIGHLLIKQSKPKEAVMVLLNSLNKSRYLSDPFTSNALTYLRHSQYIYNRITDFLPEFIKQSGNTKYLSNVPKTSSTLRLKFKPPWINPTF